MLFFPSPHCAVRRNSWADVCHTAILSLNTAKHPTRVYTFLKIILAEEEQLKFTFTSNCQSKLLTPVPIILLNYMLLRHQLWRREQWEVKKMSKTLSKHRNFLYQAFISNNSNYIAPSGDTLLLRKWFKTTGAACQNKLAGHKRKAWKYNFESSGKFLYL